MGVAQHPLRVAMPTLAVINRSHLSAWLLLLRSSFHNIFALKIAFSIIIHISSDMHAGIKLRQIRAFLDVAAEGRLSTVARQRGLTQPALSRSIAELEALLGQKLFRREGRGLVLSEAGEMFRRHAAQGVRSLEAGAAALDPRSPAGRLRVGVLPTVATRVLPAAACA